MWLCACLLASVTIHSPPRASPAHHLSHLPAIQLAETRALMHRTPACPLCSWAPHVPADGLIGQWRVCVCVCVHVSCRVVLLEPVLSVKQGQKKLCMHVCPGVCAACVWAVPACAAWAWDSMQSGCETPCSCGREATNTPERMLFFSATRLVAREVMCLAHIRAARLARMTNACWQNTLVRLCTGKWLDNNAQRAQRSCCCCCCCCPAQWPSVIVLIR
jgi:hypothetical protein